MKTLDLENEGYIQSVFDLFIKQVQTMEVDTLTKILVQILGHEPQMEDFKHLTKIYYEGELMNYDIAYKGTKIGRMNFVLNGCSATVTFDPILKSVGLTN